MAYLKINVNYRNNLIKKFSIILKLIEKKKKDLYFNFFE